MQDCICGYVLCEVTFAGRVCEFCTVLVFRAYDKVKPVMPGGICVDQIRIRGGIPLCGEVAVQGSKNAALPLMAAALLHPGRTVLRNCPHILDVESMGAALRGLGCRVFWKAGALVIDAEDAAGTSVSALYGTRFRASVLLMGSLLGRFGAAYLPYPGGCTIGQRPIDLHLQVFEKMGAEVLPQAEGITVRTKRGRLQGCVAELGFPSVGATENAVLGAVLARGTTVLKNCAAEPEITELCRFLNRKGAKIEGIGGKVLKITGVERLCDSEHELMPDRIVAGTYLLAAAGTRGQVTIRRTVPEQLNALTAILREGQVRVETSGDSIRLDASRACPEAVRLCTSPYPGFPTDLQSQIMVYLLTAKGESHIRENIFESRFQVAAELGKMGADIRIAGDCARITGPAALTGAEAEARELRGGAALVAAGLLAKGETVIRGSRFIKRGYEDICRDMACLGADVCEIGKIAALPAQPG